MNLHTSSSLLDIIDVALLAVLGVIVFIVYPVARRLARQRRQPLRDDQCTCGCDVWLDADGDR